MSDQFNCSVSPVDIRDYTLVDALERISQKKDQDLQFAIWDFSAKPAEKYVIFNHENESDPWEVFDSLQDAKDALSELGLEDEDEKEQRAFKRFDSIKRYDQAESGSSFKNLFLKPSGILIPLNFCFLAEQEQLSVDRKDQSCSSPSLHLYLGQGFRAYSMDVNDWSPVEDQSPLHLCAANAAVSLLEYYERVTDGRHLDASRLFLHQAACQLSNLPPTAGPSVRSVVAALHTFGVPPESSWPYDPSKLQDDPSAWCYAQARNYRATSYFRLDRLGIDKNALIAQIKVLVYSGIPAIFGFSVHEGIAQAGEIPLSGQLWQKLQQMQPEQQIGFGTPGQVNPLNDRKTNPKNERPIEQALGILTETDKPIDPDKHFSRPGHIPFPTFGEVYHGGHAAVVMGYDDEKIIVNRQPLRRHDRDKLRGLGAKAFLLTEDGQWEAYEWRDDDPNQQGDDPAQENQKGYYKAPSNALDFKKFKFMAYPDEQCDNDSSPDQSFNGLFILLVKQSSDSQSNSPLIPQDVLFESQNTVGIGKNRAVVDEYLATKGAFKIRNSWGRDWGEKGYGWLPYAYVYQNLTFDWWSILKFEWMNTNSFGLLRYKNDLVTCDPAFSNSDDGC